MKPPSETYTIDERTHTFSIHVDGSLVRSLVGKNLMRTYELTGNQLIIKSTSADEHWRATWQRY
jgi:Lipocalin-like domain